MFVTVMPATSGQRLAAWLLDSVFGGIAVAPFAAVLVFTKPSPSVFLGLVIAAIVFAFGVGAYLDGERSGTPGKRLIGIRWVDATKGERLGWRRALVAGVSLRVARAAVVADRERGR